MNTLKIFFLGLALLVTGDLHASIEDENIRYDGKSLVEYSGTPTTMTVSGYQVPVYPTAIVNIPGAGAIPVSLTGKGTRQKWVAILKLNIYVAASYLDNGADLTQTSPLTAVKASKAKIMKLTMLQNVTADDIINDFDDALDANGVDLNSPAVTSLRKQITFSMHAGETSTLIGFVGADGQDHLYIEGPGVSINEASDTLSFDYWKTWFGIPTDKEMQALKVNLIGNAH